MSSFFTDSTLPERSCVITLKPNIYNTSYQNPTITPSQCTLVSNEGRFAGSPSDIDRWMNGNRNDPETTSNEQRSLPNPHQANQRATMVQDSRYSMSNIWYALAIALPMLRANGGGAFRCSRSFFMDTTEAFFTRLTTVCGQARANIRRVAQEQMDRDMFATFMDVILVIYALGFLVLSLYQQTAYVG